MRAAEAKNCQNCQQIFSIEPEDFIFYEKVKSPPPTWCPECRLIRRMSWRNENTLYRRLCGLCGKAIITVYAPETELIVYCHNCWISDAWDGQVYGKEIDWDKDFFTQFKELLGRVSLVAADMKGTMINSDYGNYNGNCKNCYMCFAVIEGEDSSYCSASETVKECADVTRLINSQLCYDAVESEKDYRCAFIERTRESSDCAFVLGSSNAADCFMSKNLKNARYVFRGQQLDAKEYASKRKEVDLGSFATVRELKKEFAKLSESALYKYAETKERS